MSNNTYSLSQLIYYPQIQLEFPFRIIDLFPWKLVMRIRKLLRNIEINCTKINFVSFHCLVKNSSLCKKTKFSNKNIYISCYGFIAFSLKKKLNKTIIQCDYNVLLFTNVISQQQKFFLCIQFFVY